MTAPQAEESHEQHSNVQDAVRDIVIGMSDGLTVPFALAAGLTGAIAQIAADHHRRSRGNRGRLNRHGSRRLSRGAQRGRKHYYSELRREYREVAVVPDKEAAEVTEVFQAYGVTPEESAPVIASFRKNPDEWVRFMMRFELGLEEPHPQRALRSAATIAASYVIGGAIPLSAYFANANVTTALHWSVGITLVALAVFGFIKGHFTGTSKIRSAGQTLIVGGVAAAAAFQLARLVSDR